jgi:glycine/D-amino acid oxidase-like deaminating enzyme
MTSNRYDAVVIGGGHNGLVAAAYLARVSATAGSAARAAGMPRMWY